MTGDSVAPGLIAELEDQLGPLQVVRIKPFSVHLRNQRNRSLIKIYREINPAARQARELDALHKAPELGIAVPHLLNHGLHGNITWTEIAIASGTPLPLSHPDHVPAFLGAARTLLAPLHGHETTKGAGPGWSSPHSSTASAFLASQLSQTMRSLSCWPQLCGHLRCLDTLPVVWLHGDVKPDHILTEAGHAVLVDWEACSRGPAVLDQADATFRVLRDLTYASRLTPDATVRLSRARHHMIALTWRLTLWLDRRHSTLSQRAVALADRIARLPDAVDPIATAASVLSDAQRRGVQY